MFKKAAFASLYGTEVDQHFVMAELFYIYEIDGDKALLSEKRRFERNDGRCHDDEFFEKAYELLKDCDAVFSAKIGQSAANYLIKKNLRVFEINAKITEVLDSIIKENKKEKTNG
jgi:predicted Fe-Mo cluster-binding NifX family protein